MGLFRREEIKQDMVANSGNAPSISSVVSPGVDSSASASIIEGRKKRSDAGIARGPRGQKLSEEQQQVYAALSELYKPQTWEGIVCGPADLMLAVSGRKLWDLSAKERETISIHASLTARFFALENPKWLALVMLCISVTEIYGTRAIMHIQEKKHEDATKKIKEEKK